MFATNVHRYTRDTRPHGVLLQQIHTHESELMFCFFFYILLSPVYNKCCLGGENGQHCSNVSKTEHKDEHVGLDFPVTAYSTLTFDIL